MFECLMNRMAMTKKYVPMTRTDSEWRCVSDEWYDDNERYEMIIQAEHCGINNHFSGKWYLNGKNKAYMGKCWFTI